MGRPAELTQQRIMEVALGIVDRGGARALTIRKIAAGLGVTPMAIYRHIPDKQAILHGLLDEVIRQQLDVVYTDEPPGPWLFQTLCLVRRGLIAHPVVLSFVGEPQSFGLKALNVGEQLLAALHAAGLSSKRTATALKLLVSYTLGASALASAAGPRGHAEQQVWSAHLQTNASRIDLSTLPHVIMAAPHLIHLPTDAVFEEGLQLLLIALGIELG